VGHKTMFDKVVLVHKVPIEVCSKGIIKGD
jgi:hypothetical protein